MLTMISITQVCYINHSCKFQFAEIADAFDYESFEQSTRELKAGNPVDIPVYDFKTHSRTTETDRVEGADVIIIEGILIFFTKEMRELMDMKIFVDTDADVRLARRSK